MKKYGVDFTKVFKFKGIWDNKNRTETKVSEEVEANTLREAREKIREKYGYEVKNIEVVEIE